MGFGAAFCLFVLTAWLVLLAPARSQTAAPATVDLQLVLAVDVSRSIDDQEYELQKRGYAQAFEHPAVLQAIRSGRHRAIAVTLIEWSGAEHQHVQVPWAIITDEDSARIFHERMMATTRAFWGWTSISAAIDYSVRLLAECPHVAERRVIDVSGDGTNNSGRPVHHARDEALAAGVVVNGLVIMNDRPVPGFTSHRREPPLDDFYREQVIGGPGAFLIVVDDFEGFAHALRNKLIREIAGVYRPVALAEASLYAR